MPSTLGQALLGLLARRPMTGYELAQRMARPVGFFWQARHSQIYPELARLTADKLVRYEVIDGPGPRDTKRYEITAAGSAALLAWLSEPAPEDPTRDGFLLRIWSLWLLDRDEAARVVRERADAHAEQLAQYEQNLAALVETDGAEVEDPGRPAFASYALLRRGIAFETMAGEWCAWLLGRLAAADVAVDADPAPASPDRAPAG